MKIFLLISFLLLLSPLMGVGQTVTGYGTIANAQFDWNMLPEQYVFSKPDGKDRLLNRVDEKKTKPVGPTLLSGISPLYFYSQMPIKAISEDFPLSMPILSFPKDFPSNMPILLFKDFHPPLLKK